LPGTVTKLSWKEDLRLSAVVETFKELERSPGQKAEKLCEAILKSGEGGYWRPGERLPSEQDLTTVFPVSLGTVQLALRKLAQQGIIVRRRGDGSRVADVDDTEETDWHIQFLADDGKTFLPVAIHVLSIDEIFESGEWSNFLAPAPAYIQINRVISISDEFNVFSRFYLDGRKFRPILDLSPETLSALTMRRILHDRFNAPTFRVWQNLRFVEIEEPEAAHMRIASGTIGNALEIFGFTYRDEPVSYQEFLIPPNRRKIKISST